VADKKQDLSQFGTAKPSHSGNPQHCAQCEAMLMDALDGVLSPADQAVFDLHLSSCTACSQMVADAQRGAAWLELLKTPRPEPPADLLERIFAQTSGAAAAGSLAQTSVPHLVPSNTLLGRPELASAAGAAQHYPSNVLPFRSRFVSSFNIRTIGHNLLQPRLAMTAAMAFFSVALTLNLTGVKITALRASDLRPSSVKRSISEANAHVVRYYDNLRVVYELESRVHDLQRSSDSDSSAPASTPAQPTQTNQPGKQDDKQPSDKQDQQAKPRPRSGTSRREYPAADPANNFRYVVGALGHEQNLNGSTLAVSPYVVEVAPSINPADSRNVVQERRLA
jgi:hypothetical protein